MAKYETTLRGDFNHLLSYLDDAILRGSVSASFEDGSSFSFMNMIVAVRVYERYSWVGSNRLSLTVTVVGYEGQLFVSAITSGGSQAVFYKINTIGEQSFLEKIRNILDDYRHATNQAGSQQYQPGQPPAAPPPVYPPPGYSLPSNQPPANLPPVSPYGR